MKEPNSERIYISKDLKKEEREKEKQIRLIAKTERENGKKVKIGCNKLTIDGVVCRCNKETNKKDEKLEKKIWTEIKTTDWER